MSQKSATHTTQPQATPHIIYGEGVDAAIEVDTDQLGETMRELGISEHGIAESVLYIDPKSRLQTFGTHYPNKIGRLRFHAIPEIQEANGDIVRLSTTMKGKLRTSEEMNRTAVHELEHLAQGDRHDKKVVEGHIAIWGLAAAGALIGGKLGRGNTAKVAGALVGAVAGHSLGYMIAPHERQARRRAKEVSTSAIQRKNK